MVDQILAIATSLNSIQRKSKQGDPDPYSVQGNPLSGTTVIRLTPNDPIPLENLTISILYSYFN